MKIRPKRQTAVFCQWLLEENKNESDIWLKHLERIFQRYGKQSKKDKTSCVCFCRLEDTRNKSLSIVHYT